MLVALASVLGAGGCFHGGSGDRLTHDEFQAKVRDIVEDSRTADRLFFKLVVGEGLADAKSCGAKATEFYRELEQILGEIKELNPPEDIEALYREFVPAAEESVDRVGEVAAEARRGEVRCGTDINRELYGMPSTERAEKAIEQIEARGYLIFGK